MAAARLLALPVRLNGITLGRPTDVVLDLESRRAIGLDVLCGDGALRYLPLAAARLREDEIAVGSALVLFDDRDLAWHRRRARSLRALRGSPVRIGSELPGELSDVELAPDGTLRAVLVAPDGTSRTVPFDERVTIAGRGSESAA